MADTAQFSQLEIAARPSVADQVYAELHRQILSLELEPGVKISEVDVARAMGVSRQPVRDAFFRLSQLGFLVIRPQRSTTVSLISRSAVMRARFVRTALEVETARFAAERLSEADLDVLDQVIARQDEAIAREDREAFHECDDLFHREICERTGLGFTWTLIAENKGHMDRVRLLTLAFASQTARDDHVKVLEALRAHDPALAETAMRQHLSRIKEQIDRIFETNHAWFEDEAKDHMPEF